jgi:hypothetical protein
MKGRWDRTVRITMGDVRLDEGKAAIQRRKAGNPRLSRIRDESISLRRRPKRETIAPTERVSGECRLKRIALGTKRM